MTDKELRTLDEMLTNLEIWSTWNKTFANEMIGICSKMRNLLADRNEKYLERDCDKCKHQVNCYCVKGLGCPFEPKTEPNCSEKPNNCEPQTDCAWK